jgi:hypothetical protein
MQSRSGGTTQSVSVTPAHSATRGIIVTSVRQTLPLRAETDADDGGQAHRQRPEDHGLHHAGMADGHLSILYGVQGSETSFQWSASLRR